MGQTYLNKYYRKALPIEEQSQHYEAGNFALRWEIEAARLGMKLGDPGNEVPYFSLKGVPSSYPPSNPVPWEIELDIMRSGAGSSPVKQGELLLIVDTRVWQDRDKEKQPVVIKVRNALFELHTVFQLITDVTNSSHYERWLSVGL